MNLVMKSGGVQDTDDKAGVASMTASMLNQGTKTRSAIEIANQLKQQGTVRELSIVEEAIKQAMEWFQEMEG